MELKLRKRISNQNSLERFDTGIGALSGTGGNALGVNYRNLSNDQINRIANNPDGSSTFTWNNNGYGPDGKAALNNMPSGGGGGWGGFVQGGVQAVLTGLLMYEDNAAANDAVKDERELMRDAGQTYTEGSGFGYMRQNNIDRSAEFKALSSANRRETVKQTAIGVGGGAAAGLAIGGAIGSGAGPIGAAIGAAVGTIAGLTVGLTGAKHRRFMLNRRIFNALLRVERNNNYAQSGALTQYLLQQYGQLYGDTTNDMVYQANHGKDLKQPIRWQI